MPEFLPFGLPTRAPTADHNGRFIVAAIENPRGYKPGLYYYVMHLPTRRKVSRYLRRIGSADRKATKYAEWYAAGDRYWPAVGRCDELETNPDAVVTPLERLLLAMGAFPCLP